MLREHRPQQQHQQQQQQQQKQQKKAAVSSVRVIDSIGGLFPKPNGRDLDDSAKRSSDRIYEILQHRAVVSKTQRGVRYRDRESDRTAMKDCETATAVESSAAGSGGGSAGVLSEKRPNNPAAAHGNNG
ncbi:hypothetical protein AND_009644 [Anopheles darlingi]|uniref:Uncharacterized protein n=1 Tax=Anopheles darlingi TaxID=43151 RepID=W5J5V4_ANODA|nr:hypothetical protein AND_009644 [Anopheles darlingi]